MYCPQIKQVIQSFIKEPWENGYHYTSNVMTIRILMVERQQGGHSPGYMYGPRVRQKYVDFRE